MADLERVISIVFNGVDNTGKAIDSALGNLSKAGQKVQDIAGPIADVTEKVLLAEAAAATFAIAFGVKAYDASVKFEAAQKDLAKVLNDSDPAVESFTRGVIELSNAYGESSTNILQGIANYKQAGFTAEEASQLVKNGLDLIIAGDLEAAQASELLVSILKGFKAPASDASQILEILNATSNTYATSVEELAKGMAGLSPIADKMGLDFKDTAAVLTPVIEVFRSGDEAAVALKTGLLKLIDDSKPVQEALASIGVAQTDANGKFRVGKDILLDVSKAFGTMDETQKLAFTSQLVGIDQSARMVEVFDSLANGSVDVNKALRESATVAEEVAIKLNSAEGAGKKTAAAFENLQIAIGSKFRDQMAGVVDAVGEIFREFEKAASGGALDSFFEAINPKLKELERIAREVAAALPEALANADYSGFSRGLDVLFGGLADVKIDAKDLQGVIEGIGSTFESLANFTKGVGEVFGGVISAVKPLIELFLSLDADTQKLIGTIGGAAIVIDKLGAPLSGLFGILKALQGLGGIPGALGDVSALGKLNSALIGQAGLATGVGLLTFELTKLTGADKLLNDILAPDWLFGEGATIGTALYDAADALGLFGDEAKATAPKVNEQAESLKALNKDIQDWMASQGEGLETAEDVAAINERLTKVFADQGLAYDAATGALKSMGEAQAEATQKAQDAEDAARGYKIEIIDGITTFTQVGNIWKKPFEEAAQKTIDATKKADEFLIKMEELASNERIKTIEAAVSLNIAELEAQTKQVESAFKSIDTTIESTGNLLGTLFEQFPGLDDMFPDRKLKQIEDQIERENKLRKQAADDQHRLVEEQIKALQARTRALNKGDALIKVSAEGLAPHLEAIWFEVLEALQVRATAEGQEYLLGLNP